MRTRFTGCPVSAATTRPEIAAVPWGRSTCAEVSRARSSLALRLGLAVQHSPGYAHEQEEGDVNGPGGAATFDHCIHSIVKPTRWVEMR